MSRTTAPGSTRQRFLLANWKSTKSYGDACDWLEVFAREYQPAEGVQVILAPPLIWLARLADRIEDLDLQGLHLAGQDVSPFPAGSYTGATPADMIRAVAGYVIIGHPERRKYFRESNLDATNKVSEALDAGLKPIICVDTSYAMSQLTSLHDMDTEDLVIAYCPRYDASYREALAPEKVEEAAGFIEQILPSRPVVYGGGIEPGNTADYTTLAGLSGLFVGQASGDPVSFLRIYREMVD
jgi:triosephosphate isomerase